MIYVQIWLSPACNMFDNSSVINDKQDVIQGAIFQRFLKLEDYTLLCERFIEIVYHQASERLKYRILHSIDVTTDTLYGDGKYMRILQSVCTNWCVKRIS